MERFVVKHYASDPHPSIKGNGFDGLTVGDVREEAEEFINFINTHLCGGSKDSGTQPTDVQQLKAEIAALVREWDECQPAYEFDMAVSIMVKLRQLSAV